MPTQTVAQKTSKSNLNSGATPAAKIAPGSVPPVNPVNLKEAQNTGPAQVVPTGQPATPLPLAPAPIVARPHDDLAQNMTFSMDNPDMTVTLDLALVPNRVTNMAIGLRFHGLRQPLYI